MSQVALAALAFIVASYLLYPLWLTVRVRLLPRPWRRAPVEEAVTVVMAAHNESGRLRVRLENLLAMECGEQLREIIVVLDGCHDDSAGVLADMARQWRQAVGPRLTVIEQSHAGKAVALNRAMAEVTTPLVLFADARQSFEPGVMKLLLENFADPAVGAVSGSLCFVGDGGEPAGLYWRLEKRIRYGQALTGSVMGVTGAIYALRTELFCPLRPDELVDDLATPLSVMAAGSRVVFDERARAWDEPSTDAGREWRRKVRTLTGVWQSLPLLWQVLRAGRVGVVLRFMAHKGSRLLVPWALLVLLLSSLLSGGLWFWFGVVQLAGYSVAALAHNVLAVRRLPLVSTGYFFVLLNMAAAQSLWLALRGANRQLWTRSPPQRMLP
jgi:poly-beta-1,6-N-acetyl-D-glucosamine synthase